MFNSSSNKWDYRNNNTWIQLILEPKLNFFVSASLGLAPTFPPWQVTCLISVITKKAYNLKKKKLQDYQKTCTCISVNVWTTEKGQQIWKDRLDGSFCSFGCRIHIQCTDVLHWLMFFSQMWKRTRATIEQTDWENSRNRQAKLVLQYVVHVLIALNLFILCALAHLVCFWWNVSTQW